MWLLPIKGITAIAKKLNELIEGESSEPAIMQQLVDLQMRLEANKIDLDQYDQKEGELLDRLEAIRAEKDRQKEIDKNSQAQNDSEEYER